MLDSRDILARPARSARAERTGALAPAVHAILGAIP
jgi:hypothetical protein